MVRISKTLAGFPAHRRGNVSIIFGLTSLVVFGAAGGAIDYGRAYSVKSTLAHAAEAAALAWAAAGKEASEDERLSAATAIFTANTIGVGSGGPVQPSVQVAGDVVTVDAQTSVQTSILNVLGIAKFDVAATAKAMAGDAAGASGPACVLALNEHDAWGIKMGSSSGMTTNCGVYVNNSGSRAIELGSGSMTSAFTAVVGTWETRSDFTYTPTPTKVSAPMRDPLSALEAPVYSKCDYTRKRVDKAATLQPGVYCEGLEITTRELVTFSPGTYIITGGNFKMGSDTKAAGKGVFFFLRGSNTSIDWGSGANMNFTAPTSGTYKGILIWGYGAQGSPHVMGSHTSSVLQGVVYSPDTKVIIGCSGEVGASADWTAWVVRSLEVGSSAKLRIMTNYASSATPLPDGFQSGMTVTPKLARLL